MENNNSYFNGLRAVKQYFDWGNVKWLNERENLNTGKMTVGHVTFLPNKRQGKHLHTADEQILYTISGRGEHWVNEKYYPLIPGTVYHMPPYIEHDIRNLGNTPLEMIIVYNANNLKMDNFIPDIDLLSDYAIDNVMDKLDIDMLQHTQDGLANALDLCIVIRDEDGKMLTKPSNTLEFCSFIKKYNNQCKLINNDIKAEGKEAIIVPCCYDLVKIESPIYFNDKYIGSILCGPVILNEHSHEIIDKIGKNIDKKDFDTIRNAYLSIKKVTMGRIYAIMDFLKVINKSIVELGIKSFIHEEMHKKTLELLNQNNIQNQMEKALLDTKMKLIQAQISPHFLFNTLSVIGQLAYMKGAEEAADTTFALSNLLRTSLSKSQDLITVEDEINYIKDYILIQNKRFDEGIKIILDIDNTIMNESIPFMTIQPLVENAIAHGFSNLDRNGIIKISIKKKCEKIFLAVSDNGMGIKDEKLIKIKNCENNISDTSTGLGLMNLKKRLKYYYKDNFKIDISSVYGVGTDVFITIPIIRKGVF